MTREEIIKGLSKIGDFFRDWADMAVGDGKMLLLNWMKCAEEAAEAMRAQKPRVMTLEEAQSIRDCGTLVWLETSGGYEETRYKAIPAIVSDNTHGVLPEDAMYFYNTAGRAWNSYNRYVCGWRLWTAEPTDEQRKETAWPGA